MFCLKDFRVRVRHYLIQVCLWYDLDGLIDVSLLYRFPSYTNPDLYRFSCIFLHQETIYYVRWKCYSSTFTYYTKQKVVCDGGYNAVSQIQKTVKPLSQFGCKMSYGQVTTTATERMFCRKCIITLFYFLQTHYFQLGSKYSNIVQGKSFVAVNST